ncbi:4283_t:CDS:2, partial [Cetraspora pellucida]
MNVPFMDPENYSALFELPLDLLFPVSSSSHTFTAPPELDNINFSDLSLPLNPVLSNLTSPGPSQNSMSTMFPEPIDINSPVDFLSPSVNFSSDHHQPSDLNDDGIITDTDPEESENLIITSELDSNLIFGDWEEFKAWLDDYSKKQRFSYRINSFVDKHNHVLSKTIHETAPRFRKLTPEMLSDIEKYVIQSRMDFGSIYPLLKHDYPNKPIFKKDLYNAVYQFRAKNNPGDSDAFQMLQILLSWKESNPLWVVKVHLDPFSRRLNRLLWMSPSQRSRIVATAVIDDETLDTFRWIFNTLFEKMSINPKVIFTDSDPSMISMIKEIYPNTNHLLCIFHIDMNIRKKLKSDAQSTQRIESINKQIHDKVDRATSLCDLLANINNYIKNEKHFERFEVERSTLPTVGLPILNTMLFRQVDDVIKTVLTPIMLGKQRLQMNQSIDDDNEEVNIGLQEQEQGIRQILFKSLIKNVKQDEVLEVWNIRATGKAGIGHYIVLLNDATFHVALILSRWYLEPNIDQKRLLQQTSAFKVCCAVRSEGVQHNITFEN